ncbi:hypothetical protein LWI28_025330 [Acer negundo]|uniref:Uncharacterized protein n=1 Tax=Acer negundo TaxID=4023 RepID=A0AAD5JRG4_ACENE|nr:hypothetical protein LWI28_025330 [Acer negundo]
MDISCGSWQRDGLAAGRCNKSNWISCSTARNRRNRCSSWQRTGLAAGRCNKSNLISCDIARDMGIRCGSWQRNGLAVGKCDEINQTSCGVAQPDWNKCGSVWFMWWMDMLRLKESQGADKKTHHYLPNGFKKFVVHNARELELLMMHNRTYYAEIAHDVSTKKRREIVERASQLDVVVTCD